MDGTSPFQYTGKRTWAQWQDAVKSLGAERATDVEHDRPARSTKSGTEKCCPSLCNRLPSLSRIGQFFDTNKLAAGIVLVLLGLAFIPLSGGTSLVALIPGIMLLVPTTVSIGIGSGLCGAGFVFLCQSISGGDDGNKSNEPSDGNLGSSESGRDEENEDANNPVLRTTVVRPSTELESRPTSSHSTKNDRREIQKKPKPDTSNPHDTRFNSTSSLPQPLQQQQQMKDKDDGLNVS